jgi:peptidoglycan-associated lipoprotein
MEKRSDVMRQSVVFGGMLLVTLVAASGCASRSWVRELEGHIRQHGQQIDTDSKRVDGIVLRVDGLGQRVDDLDGRVGQLARHHHAPNVVEVGATETEAHVETLDDGAMTRLHELAKSLKADSRLNLELVGFTDASGAPTYNVQLAQRRVEAVRRYLVQRGVQVSRIAAIGLGPVGASERGVANAQKRRVTIHITMPEAMVVVAPTSSGLGGSASPLTADKPQSQ